MKKILLIIISILMFVPAVVCAETEAQDLMETLERANITPSITNYGEQESQVPIYLFWSDGCYHCHDFLEFINEELEDYGSKIKMRSYETSNESNYNLEQKVAKFFNIKAPGVPLIVIGENTIYGFGEDNEEQILEAIDEEYSSDEKYDVFEEMEKAPVDKRNNVPLYIFAGLCAGIVLYIVIMVAKKEK